MTKLTANADRFDVLFASVIAICADFAPAPLRVAIPVPPAALTARHH